MLCTIYFYDVFEMLVSGYLLTNDAIYSQVSF